MSENTTFLHFLSRGNFGVFRGISPRADPLLCAKTAQFFGGKSGSFWAKFGTPKFPKCALFAHLQKKVHFFRQKFPPGFFGFWQNFIIFMKFIIDYNAKLPQRTKKGGVKLVKKKNSEIPEKVKKSDGNFRGVFSVFFAHFSTPQKSRKSTITAQNTPFLKKPENDDFGNSGNSGKIFPRNFPPKNISHKFS